MSWAWPQLQKSGPAKTGPAGPLATALLPQLGNILHSLHALTAVDITIHTNHFTSVPVGTSVTSKTVSRNSI